MLTQGLKKDVVTSLYFWTLVAGIKFRMNNIFINETKTFEFFWLAALMSSHLG